MSKGTIFLIDDDLGIREAIRELLELEGYVVHTFPDGEGALSVLRDREPPDLILLDMMMPGMSGMEFRVKQRELGLCPDTPVVLMSAGSGLERMQNEALLAGHISKPMEMDALLEVVRANCRPRRGRIGAGDLFEGKNPRAPREKTGNHREQHLL